MPNHTILGTGPFASLQSFSPTLHKPQNKKMTSIILRREAVLYNRNMDMGHHPYWISDKPSTNKNNLHDYHYMLLLRADALIDVSPSQGYRSRSAPSI